ncbi:MAG: hypothetical protein IT285_03995 [Bdellovibrionales bacterium]|nr:hypothetical protein [Bdellovibrionales bacterium]
MNQALGRIPYYVCLFALYPALYLAATNPGQAPLASVLAAAASAATAAIFLVLLLRAVLGDWDRAGIAVLALVLLFYAYGPVHSWLELRAISGLARTGEDGRYAKRAFFNLHRNATLVFAALAVLVPAALRFLLQESSAARARRTLNLISALLVGVTCIQLVVGSPWARSSTEPANPESAARSGKSPEGNARRPDIYVIVLDGYARADVLKSLYKFDNSPFLDGLRRRGFAVGERTVSNYYWTALSLASSLNYDYIPEALGNALPANGRDYRPIYEAVRNNAAARFLKAHGYRYVHFQSSWGATLHNVYADEQVSCRQGFLNDEFLRTLQEMTWLKALQSRASVDLARCVLSHLDTLADSGGKPGPKFVVAHFVQPHHPYLFNREGKILRQATLSNQMEFQKKLWEKKDAYLDQLIFMNHRITEAIDRILAESTEPPVILLHSDHGPNLQEGMSLLDQQKIRFPNFQAYFTPDAPPHLMDRVRSPVNQLRVVFNHYFGAELPILADKQIYSSYHTPYKFKDVSTKVQ